MIVLEGLPALSPFRSDRLQARLRQIVPELRVIGAWHVYFLQGEQGAASDLDAIGRILEGCPARQEPESGASSRFVTPRLGTVSPWASKATEILQGAGHPVKRVERGLRLVLPIRGDQRADQPRLHAGVLGRHFGDLRLVGAVGEELDLELVECGCHGNLGVAGESVSLHLARQRPMRTRLSNQAGIPAGRVS